VGCVAGQMPTGSVVANVNRAAVEGPGPHWGLLADWELFAVNNTGNISLNKTK
jgi:hypothetical protein